MSREEAITSWIKQTAELLVDDGDLVQVECQAAGVTLYHTIKTTRPGLIIGQGGRNITAIRQLSERMAPPPTRIKVDVEEAAKAAQPAKGESK